MNHLRRRVKKLEMSAQRRQAERWICPDYAELERRTLARLSAADARLAKEYGRARDNGKAESLSEAHQEAWRRFEAVYNQVSSESEWPIVLTLDDWGL